MAAALSLLVAVAPAQARTPPRTGAFEGMTVQRSSNKNFTHPLTMRVTEDRRMKLTFLEVKACARGNPRVEATNLRARLRRGAFTLKDTDVRPVGDSGSRQELRYEARGRVTGSEATGIIRVTSTVRDAGGAVVDECQTGTVRFTAHRGSGQGGRTSQGLPVTVQGRDDRAIRRLWITWRTAAACPETGESVLASPKVLDLALDAGGAGRREATVTFFSGEIEIRMAYTVTAVRRRGRTTGTLQVIATLLRSDGSVLAPSCASPLISWTANGNGR